MLDCVIVGYNDVDFATLFSHMESLKDFSGAYRNMLNNTVLLRGKRLNYMDLLNFMLTEAAHRPHHLHTAKLPNLASCYLKSYLVRRGFAVETINFFNDQKEELARLLDQGVRAVAITTTFYVESSPLIEIVKFVRSRNPKVKIIAGGPHLLDVCRGDQVLQDYQLETIGADIYIHDSQGEATLARVLTALRYGQELTAIPNLVLSKSLDSPNPRAEEDGPLTRTARETENNSLDENIIDWNHFSPSFYTPTVQMRTARSCAFKCSFCKYPVIAGPLALASVDAVRKEMRQLQAAGVENLVFVDDTFNIPLRRFKELLRMMIAEQFNFNWFSFFRCSDSDDEAFDLMAASGCKGVFLGIESGDESVLVNMNKHATTAKYKHGIQRLRERDILTFGSFIIGFPGETDETVQNTIDFIEETRPTYYRAEIYFHADNVPVQQQAGTFKLRGGGYSWRHQTMDWRKASDWVDHMYRTIKGSIIFPLYMFDFWSIPYLMGAGISLEQIKEFAVRSQPLLVRNLSTHADPNDGVEEAAYQDLLVLCREIAPNLRQN